MIPNRRLVIATSYNPYPFAETNQPQLWRHYFCPPLVATSSSSTKLNKIIIIEPGRMEPFTISCSLINSVYRGDFQHPLLGLFYGKIPTRPGAHVCIQEPNPMEWRIKEGRHEVMDIHIEAVNKILIFKRIVLEFIVE